MTLVSRSCGGCGKALPLVGPVGSCPHCGAQLRGTSVTTTLVRQPVSWRLLLRIAGVFAFVALLLAVVMIPMTRRARHREATPHTAMPPAPEAKAPPASAAPPAP